MAKKYSLQLIGADSKPLYLRNISLRTGTIYPTHIEFTADKKFAAVFEKMDVFEDAADAVDAFMYAGHGKGKRCSCVPAHRNTLGVFYISFK